MASEAQIQRERKAALRAVRKEQRATDTALEVWEREAYRLLRKKRLIDMEDGSRLVGLYNTVNATFSKWESALQYFLKVLS